MLHEAAPCTCGLLYGSCGGGCSLLFAAGAPGVDHHYYRQYCGGDGEHAAAGGFEGPYGGGGSVDCTLSLGTPSTRRAEAAVAGLPWDPSLQPSCNGRQEMSGGAASAPRRCANCDTTSTPLWRNGPRGPKSLCNACGIRYKKEERRAAAAAVAPTALASDSGVDYAYGYPRQQQQWGCYGPAVAKAASFGAFGDAVSEDGPCLPWGLGVMPSSPAFSAVREVPSLFQYY
ncbi:GATA transcription factor 15-like [Oryza brachyantha]|nr:GATA transcription factor 15-like [Oryza brachyantha]